MAAAVLVLSAAAHPVVAVAMTAGAGMAMSAQAADTMASHDAMPCPMSSDCSKEPGMSAMACFAHCATVLGVLAEPAPIPVATLARPVDLPMVPSLASLHGPPDSPPPKLRILI